YSVRMRAEEKDMPRFKYGSAYVTVSDGNNHHKSISIHKDGTPLDEKELDIAWRKNIMENEGLARWHKPDDNNIYGFIDTKGKLVIPFKYDDVTYFSEGLALVRKGGKAWGFIDKKNKEVIAFSEKYDYHPFHDGRCLVKETNGKYWGYLDKTGNV